MKLRHLICATIIAVYAMSFSAFAESRPGTLNFTVGYGYNFFAAKRQLDDVGTGLLALGYNLTSNLGVEAMLGVYNTSSSAETSECNHCGVHGKLFLFDGVYHFWPVKQFEPYVLFGLGVLGLSYNNTDPNNEANVNAGLGVQYFFSDRVTFRIEGRDIYTITGGKNDAMLDAGVNFLFDAG